jgi:hypothetical protein
VAMVMGEEMDGWVEEKVVMQGLEYFGVGVGAGAWARKSFPGYLGTL